MKISSKLILILTFGVLTFLLFNFFKTSSYEIIPPEEEAARLKLNKAITSSKFNIDQGIKELESLKELPDYTDYKRSYILARLYEKKNDVVKALSIYENILNKNYPLKERIIFHHANLNASLGNDKTALKHYNKLLRDFPNSRSVPQTKYYLAQTLLRLKFTSEAINILLSLKKEFPDTQFGIATNYYLGEHNYNKKDFNGTLNYWREYLKLSPDGRFASEIIETIKSQKLFSLLPSDYSLFGNVFFHKKDYKNAAYYYKIESNPLYFYNLGYSLYRINQKNEAIHYLKEFAHAFPKSKDAKWALYYGGVCTPTYSRKPFFTKATKDIPELAYYTKYKEAMSETSKRFREKSLIDYISQYPNSEFTLDAVWEIMWLKIENKDYKKAEEIGEKYIDLNRNSSYNKTETRAKIGFWLGKIAEINNEKEKAIKFYEDTKDILFDNYYSHRALSRLLALTGKEDKMWKQFNNVDNYQDFNWLIPVILKPETLKSYYGSSVYELINLQQFDEAIELIGKIKSPSKQVTAWLLALNEEYESSINLANTLAITYNYDKSNSMWKLAYPLYFWQEIITTCKSPDYKQLDPFLIAGLIRQESRFDKKALSISNAFGLMQLIPPTARTISRQTGTNLSSLENLYDPKINIALGIHYLSGLISDFSNPLFAVSSYNAGPQATKKWINSFYAKSKDLDFFVEEIPYEQTRNYVKKVFASYWTYKKLYS